MGLLNFLFGKKKEKAAVKEMNDLINKLFPETGKNSVEPAAFQAAIKEIQAKLAGLQ